MTEDMEAMFKTPRRCDFKYKCGEEVIIKNSSTKAVVVSITVYIDDRYLYELSWMSDGKRITEYFQDFEIEFISDNKTIGFIKE